MRAQFTLLAVALLVVSAHVAMGFEDDGTKSLEQLWKDWKAAFNKAYETAEEDARRFEIFKEGKQRKDEHNEKFKKGEVTYTMGLNQFSDLTQEEFRQRHLGGVLSRKDKN